MYTHNYKICTRAVPYVSSGDVAPLSLGPLKLICTKHKYTCQSSTAQTQDFHNLQLDNFGFYRLFNKRMS